MNTTSTMLRLTLVVSWIALAACQPPRPPNSPAPPPGAICESLDTLLLGKRITIVPPPENSFQPPTMDIAAHPFTWKSGVTTSTGFSEVGNKGLAGGSLNELAVNNVVLSVSIGFGKTLQNVCLSFGEYGGNLNVLVNNSLTNFYNFSDIAGTTLAGGVAVKLFSGGHGNDKGQIEFMGNMVDQASGVGQFAVGGQELWIDDICVTP